ncbi:MAG: GDYXXLXY domain-containing protein [Xanthobacteraceae bacterium]
MRFLTVMTGWIPRVLLFAVAALIQTGLVAAMVYDRIRVLREGAEVILQTRPVDPRDFLRGDYVVLTYDISNLAAGELKGQPTRGRGTRVFVKLAPRPDGVYEVQSVHAERVPISGREVLIRGSVISGATCGGRQPEFCDRLNVRYGIERYFVPEGEGRAIESARNQGKVLIVAAVTPAGRAAIKRLLLDGKPVYDEPMF